MKTIPKLILIALPITIAYSSSCSKKSSSSPPPTCSTPSACIVNTWNLTTWEANYNASIITIYAKGSNSNLYDGLDSVSWQFDNNGEWIEYSSPKVVHDQGTWKILSDNKTVEINSTYPDTFSITSVTSSALSVNIPFNHNYPSADAIGLAIGSGLDTSKLSAYMVTFGAAP